MPARFAVTSPSSAILKMGVHIAVILSFGVAVLSSTQAWATAVKEAPWRADAAAYRTSLFLANLQPIPWDQIADVWESSDPGTAEEESALSMLSDKAGDASVEAIRAAIESGDRHSLFSAVTRGVARALINHLDMAEADLSNGNAVVSIAAARELYRAFEDGIAAADPEAARRLGLAWLELFSAAGSRGVLGAGAVAPDRDRFLHSKEEVEAYITANFSPQEFTPRAQLHPIPESIVARGTSVEMPAWLPPGSAIADQSPLPLLVLNFEEQGIDETDLPLVAFGDMLFDSAEIFGDPARSAGIACSTCHNRSDINQAFFIPGVSHQPGAADVDGGFFNPLFNDRRADSIDIPSLRGLRFTGPYGRDGRFASLRDFVRNVIVSEFGGSEPTPFMLDALVAYLLEFDFLPNSKLTSDGQLTETASNAAQRGEAIFKRPFANMNGYSCASCHIPSANFLDRKAHDIGSATPGYEGARAGAFDTPTLLGVRFTAPYMHDGSLPTLASVVDWFDGRYALGLSEAERSDLTAYLDAVGGADEPYEEFDAENTPFRLAFEELTTFASTLDMLLPRRDAEHAMLLINTVSADLAADASAMRNLQAKPQVYALAETLAAAGEAIRAEDWTAAEAAWSTFKKKQSEFDDRMF